MGLLALGTPLEWDEAKKYADHVREHGITQFLHIWDKLKGRVGDGLLWGDEVRERSKVLEEKRAQKLRKLLLSHTDRIHGRIVR